MSERVGANGLEPRDLRNGRTTLVGGSRRGVTPPCREGVRFSPIEATVGARMQAILWTAQLHLSEEACRKATPDVALACECPPVPECVPAVYPRRSEARQGRQHHIPFCRDFLSKPSDGLEPSTPSLPCDPNGNRWQPMAERFSFLCGFRALKCADRCAPLPPRFSRRFPSIRYKVPPVRTWRPS